jgi:hypothetical protein
LSKIHYFKIDISRLLYQVSNQVFDLISPGFVIDHYELGLVPLARRPLARQHWHWALTLTLTLTFKRLAR